MSNNLSSKMFMLSKGIVESIDHHQSNGGLVKIKSLIVKSKIEGFKYDKGSITLGTKYNYEEKEDWHWKDQLDFVNQEIKKMPAYSDSLSLIVSQFQVAEDQASYWLSRFVQSLTRGFLAGRISDEYIVDQIALFNADLNKSAIDWRISTWLDGLWLEKERHTLEEGLEIRRPLPTDFETETELSLLLPGRLSLPWTKCPSAIMEISTRAITSDEVKRRLHTILDIVRLFRLVSVIERKTISTPRSFLQFSFTTFSEARLAATYKYGLKPSDIEPLQAFIRVMEPLLSPDEPLAQTTNPLGIALQRYKDALLLPGPVDSKITSAITCLEALYLKAEERMELSRRLSQRVASLFRLLGFEPLKVCREMNQAYEIRSTYIHGSPSVLGRGAAALTRAILDYARVSLVIFAQLTIKADKDKEFLINKLDNSLLNEKAVQRMQDLLGEDTLIPL